MTTPISLSFFEPYSGIYAIRCLKNGRVYIGKSTDVIYRIASHVKDLSRGKSCNSSLQRDFRRYGIEQFDFMVVERCSENDLCHKERDHVVRLVAEGVKVYNKNPASWLRLDFYEKGRMDQIRGMVRKRMIEIDAVQQEALRQWLREKQDEGKTEHI